MSKKLTDTKIKNYIYVEDWSIIASKLFGNKFYMSVYNELDEMYCIASHGIKKDGKMWYEYFDEEKLHFFSWSLEEKLIYK